MLDSEKFRRSKCYDGSFESNALPEHLLQWPFFMCPILAAAQAGLGLLINMFW